MRCIFCKSDSANSVSVEHILPESLGNVDHILPTGWVCDTCNNYFAREVEKPFLDSGYGMASRFDMVVPNKKGRVPAVKGIHAQSRTIVALSYSQEDGKLLVGAAEGQDRARWLASVLSQERGTLYLRAPTSPPADRITSRFIGKVALEIFAQRCVNVSGANEEIVNQSGLDALRRYVRLGLPKDVWPVNIRRIYAPDFRFEDGAHGPYQVLHEWTILHVPEAEYYAVIAIFGIEYTINLGGPELARFHKWLTLRGNRSPLYDDRPHS